MKRWILSIALIWCLLPLPSNGLTPEEKGLAIAVEADRRDTGFADTRATMLMTLRNRHGEESVRHMRVKVLEVTGDGDKSLFVFDRPRDVKGTGLLSYSHKCSLVSLAGTFPLPIPILRRLGSLCAAILVLS